MPKQLNRFTRCGLLLLVLSPSLALCQFVNEQEAASDEMLNTLKVHSLLVEVRKNPDDPVTRLQAIPVLQEAFNKASHRSNKVNIASALVELAQKDDIYWSALSKRAQEIVDSTAPDPLVYDAYGKGIRGAVSPEFLEWAKANNLSPNEAAYEYLGDRPADLSLMAITGDPRGLSIFRKGLSSPNYGVRHAAAQGLAILQDKDSIPLIIEAARNASAEAQQFIAHPLVCFDDPSARAAADALIPDKEILADLRQRAKEKGPRNIF